MPLPIPVSVLPGPLNLPREIARLLFPVAGRDLYSPRHGNLVSPRTSPIPPICVRKVCVRNASAKSVSFFRSVPSRTYKHEARASEYTSTWREPVSRCGRPDASRQRSAISTCETHVPGLMRLMPAELTRLRVVLVFRTCRRNQLNALARASCLYPVPTPRHICRAPTNGTNVHYSIVASTPEHDLVKKSCRAFLDTCSGPKKLRVTC